MMSLPVQSGLCGQPSWKILLDCPLWTALMTRLIGGTLAVLSNLEFNCHLVSRFQGVQSYNLQSNLSHSLSTDPSFKNSTLLEIVFKAKCALRTTHSQKLFLSHLQILGKFAWLRSTLLWSKRLVSYVISLTRTNKEAWWMTKQKITTRNTRAKF